MAKNISEHGSLGWSTGGGGGGRTTKRTAVIDKHKSEWTQNVAKDMSVVQVRFQVRVWAVSVCNWHRKRSGDRQNMTLKRRRGKQRSRNGNWARGEGGIHNLKSTSFLFIFIGFSTLSNGTVGTAICISASNYDRVFVYLHSNLLSK